jgi:hypothetical protein
MLGSCGDPCVEPDCRHGTTRRLDNLHDLAAGLRAILQNQNRCLLSLGVIKEFQHDQRILAGPEARIETWS